MKFYESCEDDQVAELYKILYIYFMKVLKFRGSALNDLRAFPEAARSG